MPSSPYEPTRNCDKNVQKRPHGAKDPRRRVPRWFIDSRVPRTERRKRKLGANKCCEKHQNAEPEKCANFVLSEPVHCLYPVVRPKRNGRVAVFIGSTTTKGAKRFPGERQNIVKNGDDGALVVVANVLSSPRVAITGSGCDLPLSLTGTGRRLRRNRKNVLHCIFP